MPSSSIASRIDYTLLRPTATKSNIEMLCHDAKSFKFRSVCVNSGNVGICARLNWLSWLRWSEQIKICSVIGFPLGAMSTEAKLAEAQSAIIQGATELDVVINLGWLIDIDDQPILAGRLVNAERPEQRNPLTNELKLFAQLTKRRHVITKLIIETGLLTDRQKILACRLATNAGFDFVKTCTGFNGGGATVSDVKLMRQYIGPNVKIKASGQIKDLATAQALIEAGADVIGTSSGVKIAMAELKETP